MLLNLQKTPIIKKTTENLKIPVGCRTQCQNTSVFLDYNTVLISYRSVGSLPRSPPHVKRELEGGGYKKTNCSFLETDGFLCEGWSYSLLHLTTILKCFTSSCCGNKHISPPGITGTVTVDDTSSFGVKYQSERFQQFKYCVVWRAGRHYKAQ